ncbi:hypothetical protein HX836_20480 [Pseudomonas yamanorum]|uniref:hypothetical protein n=1 Tax=Pseudomonas yamanorum TaxID=515393 RepID=UPI0015A26595|nr:hypothetical protein [Pseudomonas yamanorum]NVZ84196.1 hypothetical protein [Pseudomonas yamanorum]
MINALSSSIGQWRSFPSEQDEPAQVRKKRSLEHTLAEQHATDPNGVQSGSRSRNNSGGLDSLGGGRLP